MRIIAQSQAPTKTSYIHLAYLSAQLTNRISKGELLPIQGLLGAALAAALACSVGAARRAQPGKRLRAVKIWAWTGFLATFGGLWLLNLAWGETRTREQVARHVVETWQWWALREDSIAAAVEDLANTNGNAASLAARYYGTQYRPQLKRPEWVVKEWRYADLAVRQGCPSGWRDPKGLSESWTAAGLLDDFQAAIDGGKLSEAERAWAVEQFARMQAVVEAATETPSTDQPGGRVSARAP